MQLAVAGGKGALSLLDDVILRLTYTANAQVSAADAKDVLEKSLTLVNHQPYAILVDMRTILSMSREARRLFGSEHKVLAAALLGRTPMDRVLAASNAQAVHEVRFFDDEQLALDWLTAYVTRAAADQR